jgi:hypothetical protein
MFFLVEVSNNEPGHGLNGIKLTLEGMPLIKSINPKASSYYH